MRNECRQHTSPGRLARLGAAGLAVMLMTSCVSLDGAEDQGARDGAQTADAPSQGETAQVPLDQDELTGTLLSGRDLPEPWFGPGPQMVPDEDEPRGVVVEGQRFPGELMLVGWSALDLPSDAETPLDPRELADQDSDACLKDIQGAYATEGLPMVEKLAATQYARHLNPDSPEYFHFLSLAVRAFSTEEEAALAERLTDPVLGCEEELADRLSDIAGDDAAWEVEVIEDDVGGTVVRGLALTLSDQSGDQDGMLLTAMASEGHNHIVTAGVSFVSAERDQLEEFTMEVLSTFRDSLAQME